MGTSYNIKLVVEPSSALTKQQLQEATDKALVDINQKMSTYIAESELMQLNAQSVVKNYKVSTELCSVLSLSNSVSQLSDGAFDVSVGPLVNLWGFGPDAVDTLPTSEQIELGKQTIGYQKLELSCTDSLASVTKTAPLWLDVSAVAKGYATDVLWQAYKALGITNAMVEIGGELRLEGTNVAGKVWTIGVEKPSLGQSGALQAVRVSGVGVATSGDYRNYYEVDGKRVSHTIDPTTGYPITHALASVTVVADSGGEADALATALNVLGPDKGFELAESEGLAAYFIIREEEQFVVKYTEAFKPLMVAP